MWRVVHTNVPSKYLQAVTLRLPTRLHENRHDVHWDVPEGSSEFWGHILGSWDSAGGAWPNIYLESIAFWIGPNEGYPTVGIAGDDHPEQASVAECVLETDIGRLPVVLFEVRSPAIPLNTYYVGTYWSLEPGVYISAQGQAPDSSTRSQLLAALATVRLER